MEKSVLSSNDAAFPRGGASVLTPLEMKTISNKATSDVLFELAKRGKPESSRPRKKRKATKKEKTEPTKDEELSTIEHLSFKNLVAGAEVLGQISRIDKMHLVVALGDHLFGQVPITAVSEEVTELLEKFEDSESESEDEDNKVNLKVGPEFPKLSERFQVGQWVRAVVTPNDESRQIDLSIEPEMVNAQMEADDLDTGAVVQGAVKSVEDHGVVLNLGLPNVSGFISKKELIRASISPASLKRGLVILASAISVKSRVLSLRPAFAEKLERSSVVTAISSVDAVHPGTVVNAIISEIAENGVGARLFGMIDATFALPHAGAYSVDTLKAELTVGNTVRARVLAVVTSNGEKKYLLSRANRVLGLEQSANKSFMEAFPLGFVFEQVTVLGSDDMYIYVSTSDSSIVGQVHMSHTDPELVAKISYPAGSTHRARVLGFNEVDNVLLMTLNPETIDAKYVSVEDIPIGLYDGSAEVTKILPDGKGLLVKIFGQYDAVVPPHHMTDIKLSNPERKFKVGGKVRARVLSRLGRRVFVTLRKSMVGVDDDEIVTDIRELRPGFKTPGVVNKFVGGGALVSMFGNLRGFLPKNEISESQVLDAKDYLKEGQSVTVRVTGVDAAAQKITVSMRQSNVSTDQLEALASLVPGKTVISAKVTEKSKEVIGVSLGDTSVSGFIETNHLSDDEYAQNRVLYKKLSVGDTLDVVVLDKTTSGRTLMVSAKKSLILAAQNERLPSSFSDVVEGATVYGYIKSVTSMGLFVYFADGLKGLIPPRFATKEAGADLTAIFHKNQSVTCRVNRVDDPSQRFWLSILSCDAGASVNFSVKNPVDSKKLQITDYSPGTLVKGVVAGIEPSYLVIRLADNLTGRIEANQVADLKKKKTDFFTKYPIGTNVSAKIMGFQDSALGNFSEVAPFAKDNVVQLLVLKSVLKENKRFSATEFEAGSKQTVCIGSFEKGNAIVSLAPGVRGSIAVYNLSNDIAKFANFKDNFAPGTVLDASVLKFDSFSNTVILSARDSVVDSIQKLQVGDKYPARIFKVAIQYVLVELAPDVIAYSYITDALDNYDDVLQEVRKVGDGVMATITEVNKADGRVQVSLQTENAKDKPLNSIDELKRGEKVRGFVKSITNAGLYVSLGRDLYALVRVTDISDRFLADWKKFFHLFQCVTGKISQCKAEGRILVTLKESELKGDLTSFKNFEELEVGQTFEGSVQSVAEYGVFVRLDGTRGVSGLCHRSEITETPVADASLLFSEGDRVKVKILTIDPMKKQLGLGMKASYFVDHTDSDDAVDAEEGYDLMDVDGEDNEAHSDSESGSDSESESDNEEKSSKPAGLSGLSGLSTNGFDWTASILDQAADIESSDDEGDFTDSRKRKRSKKQTVDKTAEMNARAPQSVSDFERLLIGNPDSSVLWMNYMSFQLQLGEIDKSREIAERALKTINYREEQEKMNIWIALLNLENSFGSDETLDETFKRAVQYMDALTMYQKLIGIYVLSEKFDSADSLFKVMTKKFSDNVSVWVQNGQYFMEHNRFDEAHEVLARSLQSLPKRDHIDVVRKFGQLEFSIGDPEQGRSLFEGLISDAPKRIDLWNVYIDQEVKQGDMSKTRSLFERVFTKKLSRKQAKFFFLKWLAFEEENGDEQSSARVKALAVEYVQANAKDENE